MKVEISPKPGQLDRLVVTLDQEPWRELHVAVHGRHPKLPACTERSAWETLFADYEYKRAKHYLLRRLQAQSYHSVLLRTLLIDRLISPTLVARLLQEANDWGLLDDQAWLDSFMRSQKKRRGLPLILAKLRLKGFNNEQLQKLQEEYADPQADEGAIRHLLKTKYRSKDLSQYAIKQKVIASLMRRGYAYTTIQNAMKTGILD